MDELPPELIIKIFQFINLHEIFKLRRLSKRYKFIIDNMIKYNQLIISDDKKQYLFLQNWHKFTWFNNPNEYVDLTNFIYLSKSNYHYFNSILCDQKFDNIQKLFIRFSSADLSFLLRFNRLDCLHIIVENQKKILKKTDKLIISNYNLTKLKIQIDYIYVFDTEEERMDISTTIDCPKLKYLSAITIEKFNFIYPESIIYFTNGTGLYPNIEILKILPELETYEVFERPFFFMHQYLKFFNLVKRHSKIKKIIIHDYTSYYTRNNEPYYIMFIDHYLKLNLKRDIEIYMNGLLIKDNINSDNYVNNKLGKVILSDNNLSILLNYYSDLLDTIPGIRSIDYSEYEPKLLENKIPDCFTNKLIGLEVIDISKSIINQDRFFKFVFDLNRIHTLTICRVRLLKDDFFTNLVRYIPKLIELNIWNEDEQDLNIYLDNLDVNFLFKLKYLEELCIVKELELNLIRDLFVNLNYLTCIYYRFKNDDKYDHISANTRRDIPLPLLNLIPQNQNKNKIKISNSEPNKSSLEFNFDYNFDLDKKKLYKLFDKKFRTNKTNK